MKYAFMAVICSFLMAGSVSAKPQDIDDSSEHVVAQVPDGPELSFDEVLKSREDEANFHGYWHCTAYAEGHGHSWGFDYRDVHYNHAYWGAMRRCEYATGHHCHDVHCHYDHQ